MAHGTFVAEPHLNSIDAVHVLCNCCGVDYMSTWDLHEYTFIYHTGLQKVSDIKGWFENYLVWSAFLIGILYNSL